MVRPVILAVGPLDGPLKSIESVLQRSSLDVHQAPSGSTALTLAAATTPHLLVAGLPLSDMPAAEFLERLNRGIGAMARTRVVLLAAEEERPALDPFLDDQHVLLETDRDSHELVRSVLDQLGITQRAARRVMLRLEVVLGAGIQVRACQSENISETGILVHSEIQFPVGCEVQLEISLPSCEFPIRVKADVVRHAGSAKESVHGLGLRFVEFTGNGQEILREYLRSQDTVD